MANWEGIEDRRYLTVSRTQSRRHRQPSLHRGYHSDNEGKRQRAGGYDSDSDRSVRRERVGSRKQVPSPPRITRVIEPAIWRGSKGMQLPSPPRRVGHSDQKPTYTTTAQYAFTRATSSPRRSSPISATRRSSVPNLQVPTAHPQGLHRYPSDPKRKTGNLAGATHLRYHSFPQINVQQPEQSDSNSNEPPPYTATNAPINVRPWMPADLQSSWATSTAGNGVLTSPAAGVLGPESYRYDGLSRGQFRLVKILANTMSKLRCEIVPYSLVDAPEYTAISYAWGDADNKSDMMLERDVLDGEGNITRQRVKIQVTVSLHGALTALRHQTEEVLVWVDSLSIDQQNKDELSRQVQLMSLIYGRATTVAIWLGPNYDDNMRASRLLKAISEHADSDQRIKSLITNKSKRQDFVALVSLFEREYWKRLWVVQEVYMPKPERITVHCGDSSLPWKVYRSASDTLRRFRPLIDQVFPGTQGYGEGCTRSQRHYTFAQVFTYLGPGSLYDGHARDLGRQPLLDVMRVCREKLTANPLDKVFGILGLLPEHVSVVFPVNYKSSVKELYIDVVDHIIATTGRVDVLRECINFPLHVDSAGLPSWCPDWSHLPETKAIQFSFNFSASAQREQKRTLLDYPRRKLKIEAILLDRVDVHGIAVGTLTTSADFLMAFLNWRSVLLDTIQVRGKQARLQLLEDFSRTISLDQDSSLTNKDRSWTTNCHYVFSSLIQNSSMRRLLDEELQDYAKESDAVQAGQRRHVLQNSFGAHMMGRRFCITKERQYICMGSGFLGVGDIIVVPLGCATPIILRPDGHNEYRYVGDIYVHGFMYGKAIDQWKAGQKRLDEFVLH